ncbi:NERD domain-containing protein [Cerasibacillus terrae]|uniref:NERD domain-containing protein n=1 Tax=Cerasibacillus terrae TaxID=2498845 RepID=A0A5C8NZU1_9BACI|nr:nuclease-related domain-containing protein [Cerasibacillus terrae]TXL66814.1 NERD domain-containing protein [Cerasibacillus terrae]
MKTMNYQEELIKINVLNQRLIQAHPSKDKIFIEYRKKRTGVIGERKVAYRLQFLDPTKFIVLHDLRFVDHNGFFQIDKLILCTKCIFVVEVKNWYGTVIFGENGQVTRIGDNEKEEGLPNPVAQAELQKLRLHGKFPWLNFPIITLSCISFPSTIIKSASSHYTIPKEITHANHLPFSIKETAESLPVVLENFNDLKKVARKLLTMHKPKKENVMEKFNVSLSDLIKGVFCSNCGAVPMKRKNRKWCCLKCSHTAADAHLLALNDYQLLIGDVISNKEAREFLQVKSPYIVKNILEKNFESIGKNKGRRYLLTKKLKNKE